MSRMNLERNIFDWLVNLNSFSTNEIVTGQSKIFLGSKMILEIEKMLPEELENAIAKLSEELIKKESSKGIIDLEIHKEKENIY